MHTLHAFLAGVQLNSGGGLDDRVDRWEWAVWFVFITRNGLYVVSGVCDVECDAMLRLGCDSAAVSSMQVT